MPYFLFYLEAYFGYGGSQVNVEQKDDIWMIKHKRMTSVPLKRWEDIILLEYWSYPHRKKKVKINTKVRHTQENPLWLAIKRDGEHIWK